MRKLKTNEMPVRYKTLDAGSDCKWERSLNLIFSPGCYLVEIVHDGREVGLPMNDCNDEHYVVGNLIVTESGTDGPQQCNRVVGQLLTYTNRESSRTHSFTRSYVGGSWGAWHKVMVSGDFDEIKTADDVLLAIKKIDSDVEVLMSQGEGSILDKAQKTVDKSSVSFCTDMLINSYIKELYISGEGAADMGFYIERIIKSENGSCVLSIKSKDDSIQFYFNTSGVVRYGYAKQSKEGYTVEAIINYEKVTEKWDDHVLDSVSGLLLPSSYNIDCSPCIKAIHLHEDSVAVANELKADILKVDAATSYSSVVAEKGKYLQNNGKLSIDYTDGYYSDFYPVMSNSRVKYSGRVSGNCAAWAFYDKDNSFLSAYPATNPTSALSLDVSIDNIPESARYIRFGSVYREFVAEVLPANLVAVNEVVSRFVANPLHKKSVDWIGASHMQGIVSGVKTGGFASIIAERNAMTSNNYGIGGTTVAIRQGQNNSFVERIETYGKDVDYLIVMGGANDTASADITLGSLTEGYEAELDRTTFYGAWEWLCRYVMENYSEKKYGFIVPFHIASKKMSGEWGDAITNVCKKWGMPYLDLRTEAGFNVNSVALRKIYGAYVGDVPAYDSTKGYALDEQVKFEGALYKSNTEIAAPAGTFDASKWTLQESDNNSDYDNWHCNVLGYRKLADKVEAWMRGL